MYFPQEYQILTPEQIVGKTQEFFSESDKGTLKGTLYELPGNNSLGRTFLKESPSVILNYGNRNGEEARALRNTKIRFGDLTSYSSPDSRTRLHAKIYSAQFESQTRYLISTGNLSSLGGTTDPPQSRQERSLNTETTLLGLDRIKAHSKTSHQNSRPSQYQINMGLIVSDQKTIKSLDRVYNELSQGYIPASRLGVAISSDVTRLTLQELSRVRAGSQVSVVSPYLDDPLVAMGLAQASVRGANVSVVTGNQKTASAPTMALAQVFMERYGVKLYAPANNDPLLVHAKAIAISTKNRSFSGVGSANFTVAQSSNESVDVLVHSSSKKQAVELNKIITSLPSKYELDNISQGAGNASVIEKTALLRGMVDLYRIPLANGSTPFMQAIGAMPLYPTKLSSDYFKQFRKKELPKLNLYSNLYRARYLRGEDKPIPQAISNLDKAIQQPGSGESLNRYLGFEAYTEGSGVIGSILKGSGRLLDYAFGLKSLSDSQAQAKGYRDGGIGAFYKYSMQQEREPRGFSFEALLGTMVDHASAITLSAGFYLGVTLPYQILSSKTHADLYSNLLRPDNPKQGWLSRNVRDFLTAKLFDDQVSPSLRAAAQVSRTPGEFYDLADASLRLNRELIALEKGSKAKLPELNKSVGLQFTNSLRQYQAQAFNTTLRPIFEAISPFDSDSQYGNRYLKALSNISEQMSAPITINVSNETISEAGEPGQRFVVKNIGPDRIAKIAKAWDDLGSLLPANLTYWVPGIRRALKLPDFNPETDLTIKDLLPFEALSRSATTYLEGVQKAVTHNPIRTIRDTVLKRVYLTRQQLSTVSLERQAVDFLRTETTQLSKFSPKPSAGEVVSDIASLQGVTLDDLQAQAQADYQRFRADNSLGSPKLTREIVGDGASLLNEYADAARQTDDSLRSLYSKVQDTTMVSSYDSLLKDAKLGDPKAQKIQKALGVRKGLVTAGAALLVSKVLDDFVLSYQGADFFSQVAGFLGLQTDKGSVAKLDFQATVPGYLGLSAVTGTFLLSGYLNSKRVDVSEQRFSLLKEVESNLTSIDDIYKRAISNGSSSDSLRDIHSAYKRQLIVADHLKATGVRGTRAKFNLGAATIGGLLSYGAVKGIFSLAAFAANTVTGLSKEAGVASMFLDPRIRLNPVSAAMSAALEDQIVKEQFKSNNPKDLTTIGVGYLMARSLLKTEQESGKVYNMASQFTSPYLQLAVLARNETDKQTITYGFGVQLLPILGLGATPMLPFGISYSTKRARDQMESTPKANYDLSPIDQALLMTGSAMSKLLTFGDTLAYMPNNQYEDLFNFVGLSGLAMGIGSMIGGFLKADVTAGLAKSAGGANSLRRNISALGETLPVKAVRTTASIAYKTSSAFLALPLLMTKGMGSGMQAFGRYYTHGTLATPLGVAKQPSRLGSLGRAALPYALSAAIAYQMAKENPEFETPAHQYRAMFGVGLTLGTLLYASGVSRSSYHLARSANSSSTRHFSMIGSAWKQSMASAPVELDAKATSDIPQVKSSSLLFGSARRMATAAAVVTAARLGAAFIAHSLSADHLKQIYKMPVIGETLRLLSGVSPESDPLSSSRKNTKGVIERGGIAGFMKSVGAALNSGLFGAPKMLGLYRDDPDPFFGLFGTALGASFKQTGPNLYMQFAGVGSDLSIAAFSKISKDYSLGSMIAVAEDLFKDRDTKSLFGMLMDIRGSDPRTKAASAETITPYEMAQLAKHGALARNLYIKQMHLQWLMNQSGKEQMFDYLMQGISTGNIPVPTTSGFYLDRNYNPYNVLAGGSELYAFKGGDLKEGYSTDQRRVAHYIQQGLKSKLPSNLYNPIEAAKNLNIFDSKGNPPLMSMILNVSLVALGISTAALALGSFAWSGVNILAGKGISDDLYDSLKKNPLYTGKQLLSPNQFFDIDSKSISMFKFGILGQTHRVPLYKFTTPGAAFESGVKRSNVLKVLRSAYRNYAGSIQKYFVDSSADVGFNYAARMLSDFPRTPFNESEVKRILGEDLLTVFNKGLEQPISKVKSGNLNLYDVLYGQTPASSRQDIDNFLQNKVKAKADLLLEELISERTRLSGDTSLSHQQRYYQILQKSLASQHLADLLDIVDSPASPSSVHAGVSRPSARLQKAIDRAATIHTTDLTTRPWSEKAMRTTQKAGLQAAKGMAWWVSLGRDLYSGVEGVAILSDSKQPRYKRQAAGEQIVKTLITASLSTAAFQASQLLVGGISTMAASSGVAAIGGAGLAAAAPVLAGAAVIVGALGLMMTAQHVIQKNSFLRKTEERVIKVLGRALAFPVDTLSSILQPLGLGTTTKQLLSPVASVLHPVAGFVMSPIRALVENATGPFIAKTQTDIQAGGGGIFRPIASFLLPTSIFASMNYRGGDQTWHGSEPWIYGDPAQFHRAQQVSDIRETMRLGGDISSVLDLEMIGKPQGFKQRYQQERFFKSYGGSRVLSKFSLDSSYVSSLLQSELERKAEMAGMIRHGQALHRFGQPPAAHLGSLIINTSSPLRSYQNLLATRKESVFNSIKKNLGRLTRHAGANLNFITTPFSKVSNSLGKYSSNLAHSFIHPVAVKYSTLKESLSSRFSSPKSQQIQRTQTLKNKIPFFKTSLDTPKSPGSSLRRIVDGLTTRALSFLDRKLPRLSHLKNLFDSNIPKAGIIPKELKDHTDEVLRDTDFSDVFKKTNLAIEAVTLTKESVWKKIYDLSMLKPKGLVSRTLVTISDGLKSSSSKLFSKFGISGYLSKARQTSFIKKLDRGLKRYAGKIGFYGISAGLAALDILQAQTIDQQLSTLNKDSKYKDFRQGYRDYYSYIAGGTAGAFAAALRVNPLLGIGAAIGASLLGAKYGEHQGLLAKDNKTNKLDSLGFRLGLTTSLSLTANSPTIFKLLKAGRPALAAAQFGAVLVSNTLTLPLGPALSSSLSTLSSEVTGRLLLNKAGVNPATKISISSRISQVSKGIVKSTRIQAVAAKVPVPTALSKTLSSIKGIPLSSAFGAFAIGFAALDAGLGVYNYAKANTQEQRDKAAGQAIGASLGLVGGALGGILGAYLGLGILSVPLAIAGSIVGHSIGNALGAFMSRKSYQQRQQRELFLKKNQYNPQGLRANQILGFNSRPRPILKESNKPKRGFDLGSLLISPAAAAEPPSIQSRRKLQTTKTYLSLRESSPQRNTQVLKEQIRRVETKKKAQEIGWWSRLTNNLKEFTLGIFDSARNLGKWFIEGSQKAVHYSRKTMHTLAGYAVAAKQKASEAIGSAIGGFAGEGFIPGAYFAKDATYLSEQDYANLLMMSSFEAAGTRNRLDVAVSIMNRLRKRHMGANTVTDVVFASEQYEPTWKDYGIINGSRIVGLTRAKDINDAIAQYALRKRISKQQASAEFSALSKIIADPKAVMESARFIQGATDFKGTTQLGYKLAGDPWRGEMNANWFHAINPQLVGGTKPIVLNKEVYEKYAKGAGQSGILGSNTFGVATVLPGTPIPEVQVSGSMGYKSLYLPGQGNVLVTGGYMEPFGHGPKSPMRAIFTSNPNKAVYLPAANRNIGIDYVTGDSSAKALLSGTVITAHREGGYGRRVRVKTDITYKFQGKEYQVYQGYAHLAGYNVKPGDRLKQGQRFGTIGGSGYGENDYGAHIDLSSWIVVNGEQIEVSPNLILGKAKQTAQSKAKEELSKSLYSQPLRPQSVQPKSSKRKSLHGYFETPEAKRSSLIKVGTDSYGESVLLESSTAKAFRQMQLEARKDGISLVPISGFRSAADQRAIYNAKKAKGMSDAEIFKYTAPPGYSEHHSGKALDVLGSLDSPMDESFAQSAQYKWLKQNAGRFGFQESYDNDSSRKGGAQYEPWHWEYQGSSKSKSRSLSKPKKVSFLTPSNKVVLNQSVYIPDAVSQEQLSKLSSLRKTEESIQSSDSKLIAFIIDQETKQAQAVLRSSTQNRPLTQIQIFTNSSSDYSTLDTAQLNQVSSSTVYMSKGFISVNSVSSHTEIPQAYSDYSLLDIYS